MRKLKLDVDALEVTSFEVNGAAGRGGTVLGRGDAPIHTKARARQRPAPATTPRPVWKGARSRAR